MSAKRRRPDGTLETRSLDDMLAEAAQDDVVQRLPGKGQPLDLHGYRHADPETRVANRLLRDNKVLPQPLQDRRDAETLEQRAIDTSQAAQQELAPLLERIDNARARLCDSWPAGLAPDALFGQRPGWWSAASGTCPIPVTDTAQELVAITTHYVRRRALARRQIESALTEAAGLTRKLNERVALSRSLPPGLQRRLLPLDEGLAAFDEQCPAIDELPADLADRMSRSIAAQRPPWWRRWLGSSNG